ncbi:E3 ubiquitin ligase complex SCF subunit sconC-like [Drosophila madeirensis]|uniref:E3 ubiquitin ligase complex SCF subunit sconC-like n=1 Tax=Drosophila madeirensis TaxID=30013 RepID=A0AAU9FYG6_DROMD
MSDVNNNKMAENKPVVLVELHNKDETIIVEKSIANRLVPGNELIKNEHLYFPDIGSAVLRKLILWTCYHKNETQPRPDDDRSDWYRLFFDMDLDVLNELVKAADVFGIISLSEYIQRHDASE